ncbi:PREDICTED: odorant receptor 4 [Papilio xuthus]|uniref:Odorant receptor n=1 Tax=Papilio xuthus TaxID=66420 RepID=A0AAJ7EDA5_PAPXU|nr:PREDICTED: odorant receptor 4 [Papilio xuthus]
MNDEWKKILRFLTLVPPMIFHIVTMSLYASKIFKNELNISELANIVPVYLICIQSLLRVAIMIYKKKEIESFIDDLGVIWRTSDRNFMQIEKKRRLVKQLKFWQTMYYWLDISGSWEYVFAPLVSTIIRIFILKQNFTFALPVGCVYPFDPTSDWFKYLATYAFQAINVLRYSWFYIGIEYMMVTLCADLAIEFSILREDLLRVKPNTINPELQLTSETDFGGYETVSIQDFIRRHQKLIRLAKQLDDIFNKIIFMNLLLVTVTVCFFGLATMVARGAAETMNNLLVMLALLLPVYEFCYYGDLLKEESLGIADSAYINEWYKSDIYYQKMILYVISRSQRPCCLTSLKYVPVTMNLFTKVLSTTWSYFSLVKSIYSRGE